MLHVHGNVGGISISLAKVKSLVGILSFLESGQKIDKYICILCILRLSNNQ